MAGCIRIIYFSVVFVFPIYNLAIDITETVNSDKMMSPSADPTSKKAVYWCMVVSTVFSALRCVGSIFLFFYQWCKLNTDKDYNICGKNSECGDFEDDLNPLLKKIRIHEIAGQVVGHLMLVENLFQSMIVFFGFVCKPSAYLVITTDRAFEINCLIDMVVFIVGLKSIWYLCSHKGSCCDCCGCCQCKCDYPYPCCRTYLGTCAWLAIVLAIPVIVLLSISIGRTEKQCVLMRG